MFSVSIKKHWYFVVLKKLTFHAQAIYTLDGSCGDTQTPSKKLANQVTLLQNTPATSDRWQSYRYCANAIGRHRFAPTASRTTYRSPVCTCTNERQILSVASTSTFRCHLSSCCFCARLSRQLMRRRLLVCCFDNWDYN